MVSVSLNLETGH